MTGLTSDINRFWETFSVYSQTTRVT